MRCPLSGKPCLLAKEIFVTEVHKDGIKNLFLCKRCGEEYIKNLTDADVVTKSMEVISSGEEITHSEHILEDNRQQQPSPPAKRVDPAQPPKLLPPTVSLMQQILQIEGKLNVAIKREDYESAARLRDILDDLRKSLAEQQEEED